MAAALPEISVCVPGDTSLVAAYLTKAELSDQLGQRDLPKTGNVDEFVERLVEADSK